MISVDMLYNIIENDIIYSPIIVYFAVGSATNKKWENAENQQFPPFLHDFKIKNMHIKILIILIDPLLNDIPNIVEDTGMFLENSFVKSEIYDNLYHSDFGVDVIGIKEYVYWNDNSLVSRENAVDIFDMMVSICNLISNKNSLLFYQEFTGISLFWLEENIKKRLKTLFNSKKICIDITRNTTKSLCYIDLINPCFYPVITINNNLEYIEPSLLSYEIKRDIYVKYKSIDTNIQRQLIDEEDDYKLYHQLLIRDQYSYELIKESLLSMIRNIYTLINNIHINTQMCQIEKIVQLGIKYNLENDVEEILKKLSDFEDIMEKNANDDNMINYYKEKLIDLLFDMFRKCFYDIGYKYDLSYENLEILIENMRSLKNKYNMNSIYNEFIKTNFNYILRY